MHLSMNVKNYSSASSSERRRLEKARHISRQRGRRYSRLRFQDGTRANALQARYNNCIKPYGFFWIVKSDRGWMRASKKVARSRSSAGTIKTYGDEVEGKKTAIQVRCASTRKSLLRSACGQPRVRSRSRSLLKRPCDALDFRPSATSSEDEWSAATPSHRAPAFSPPERPCEHARH